MKTAQDITYGFGVPNTPMPHQFIVTIPSGNNDPIEIWEDFGAAAAGTSGQKLCRVIVPRKVWRQIAEGLKAHLNRRLKEKNLKSSRFAVGANRVDRILGREISVLAWAIEDATEDEAAVAFSRWSMHRPEELWWLFQQVDRDAGEWDDNKDGWRMAVRHALIPTAKAAPTKKKRPRPVVDTKTPDLFTL
jgi:hypothetical protein